MNAAKWIAEQKVIVGIGYQTFGLMAVPFLVAHDMQDVAMKYWGVHVPLSLLLGLGMLALWGWGWVYYLLLWKYDVAFQWDNNPAYRRMLEVRHAVPENSATRDVCRSGACRYNLRDDRGGLRDFKPAGVQSAGTVPSQSQQHREVAGKTTEEGCQKQRTIRVVNSEGECAEE